MLAKDIVKVGKCYFNFCFVDDALKYPTIRVGVFLGYSLADRAISDGESLFFQETDSVAEHGFFFESTMKGECKLFSVHETALETLYDAKGLIQELQQIV